MGQVWGLVWKLGVKNMSLVLLCLYRKVNSGFFHDSYLPSWDVIPVPTHWHSADFKGLDLLCGLWLLWLFLLAGRCVAGDSARDQQTGRGWAPLVTSDYMGTDLSQWSLAERPHARKPVGPLMGKNMHGSVRKPHESRVFGNGVHTYWLGDLDKLPSFSVPQFPHL